MLVVTRAESGHAVPRTFSDSYHQAGGWWGSGRRGEGGRASEGEGAKCGEDDEGEGVLMRARA